MRWSTTPPGGSGTPAAADGTERLSSRGAHRLTDNQSARITFQLHGNGYTFAAGHTIKLVLLGRDDPYLRASNDPASRSRSRTRR